MIVKGGMIYKSDVITSSYNHFIIMRTHRWPHGPCCIDQYDTRHDFQKCQSTTEAHFDFAGPYRKKAYLNGIWRKLMSSLNQIKFEDKSYILAIEMRVRISGASGNELKRIRCSLWNHAFNKNVLYKYALYRYKPTGKEELTLKGIGVMKGF